MLEDVEEAVVLGVSFVVGEVEKQIRQHIEARKKYRTRPWVKPWIARRDVIGAATTLLREWAEDDPEQFHNHLRMTESQFDFLVHEVTPKIQKAHTCCRRAIPARTKVAMTLSYLATGDNWSTLSALYRLPKCTMSKFFPEVCDAVYSSLERYIKVRTGEGPGKRDHRSRKRRPRETRKTQTTRRVEQLTGFRRFGKTFASRGRKGWQELGASKDKSAETAEAHPEVMQESERLSFAIDQDRVV